jgi:hypothetical protein
MRHLVRGSDAHEYRLVRPRCDVQPNLAEVLRVHQPFGSVEVHVEALADEGVGARLKAVAVRRQVAVGVLLGVAPERYAADGQEGDGREAGDCAGYGQRDPRGTRAPPLGISGFRGHRSLRVRLLVMT